MIGCVGNIDQFKFCFFQCLATLVRVALFTRGHDIHPVIDTTPRPRKDMITAQLAGTSEMSTTVRTDMTVSAE